MNNICAYELNMNNMYPYAYTKICLKTKCIVKKYLTTILKKKKNYI